jgi:septum formation protein
VFPAAIDESRSPREPAPLYVWRLAELKARTAMRRLPAERQKDPSVLVAADTVVAIDGEVLGKPGSPEDARRMLRRLSGKWHEVFTGLAVLPVGSKQPRVIVERTRVEFMQLSESDIQEYVRSDEPFDKAGAYAIQGQGGIFIPRIEGCYFNVMGLPLARLYAILREIQTGRVEK